MKIITDFPIAYDSPDHLIPLGTKKDNHTNLKFVKRCENILTKKSNGKGRILDIGCAGGGSVEQFISRGHDAYGLEGSDYSQKNNRASWKTIPEKLFTVDASRPFVLLDGGSVSQFDIIYSFEVMEHISKNRLPIYFSNIYLHMKKDAVFIGSYTCTASKKFPTHHQTVMSPKHWIRFIKKLKMFEIIDLKWRKDEYLRFSDKKPNCIPVAMKKNIK